MDDVKQVKKIHLFYLIWSGQSIVLIKFLESNFFFSNPALSPSAPRSSGGLRGRYHRALGCCPASRQQTEDKQDLRQHEPGGDLL